MKKEFLHISGGRKEKNGLTILQDFYLTLNQCEITLVTGGSVLEMDCIADILSGRDAFSAGHIFWNGKKVNGGKAAKLFGEHITELSEKNELIGTVSIADNFCICNDKKQPIFVRDRRNHVIVEELLRRFGIQLDIKQPMESLSFLQQYKIQLVKQHYLGKRIVMVDKRKTSMSNEEFSELCELMGRLKRTGMTFLVLDYVISFDLTGIDSLVVVQDSCTVLHEDLSVLSPQKRSVIQNDVMNWKVQSEVPNRQPKSETVLNLDHICTERLKNICLKVHSREIVVIYYESMDVGLELYGVLNGSVSPQSGYIRINSMWSFAEERYERADDGVACIDSFTSDGYLFENLTAFQNYCFPKGMRFPRIWYNRRYRKYLKKTLNGLLGREAADCSARELSPLEKSRIKYQSQILRRPPVLVCVDPFSSVDKCLRSEIMRQLDEITGLGTGVILLGRLEETRSMENGTHYVLTAEGTLLLAHEEESCIEL